MTLGTRKHYYRARLTKADGTQAWFGKGATEADARASARAKATDSGEDPDTLAETMDSLVGPAPRTFTGNDDLPPDP